MTNYDVVNMRYNLTRSCFGAITRHLHIQKMPCSFLRSISLFSWQVAQTGQHQVTIKSLHSDPWKHKYECELLLDSVELMSLICSRITLFVKCNNFIGFCPVDFNKSFPFILKLWFPTCGSGAPQGVVRLVKWVARLLMETKLRLQSAMLYFGTVML